MQSDLKIQMNLSIENNIARAHRTFKYGCKFYLEHKFQSKKIMNRGSCNL